MDNDTKNAPWTEIGARAYWANQHAIDKAEREGRLRDALLDFAKRHVRAQRTRLLRNRRQRRRGAA